MNNNPNMAIECSIGNCAHHCSGQNYCSLSKIVVGTHEANPQKPECVDCKSFMLRQ